MWAKLGNFSIMWVKEKPMQRRTSMLAYITVPMVVAESIPIASEVEAYMVIGSERASADRFLQRIL